MRKKTLVNERKEHKRERKKKKILDRTVEGKTALLTSANKSLFLHSDFPVKPLVSNLLQNIPARQNIFLFILYCQFF